MRFAYSAQAVSAQAGSLAATATTRSLATRCTLLFRRALCSLLHPHRLAAPHFLEIVEAAHRRMHDVHHDLAQVDEHPFAARLPLDAVDAGAGFAHLVLQVIGERPDLARRVAARDHHALEHRGHARRVEDDDVVALHVLQGIDHQTLLVADIHYW